MRISDYNQEDLLTEGLENAPTWQLDLLKLNPSYPHWGPGQDSMYASKDDRWANSYELETWDEFQIELDDYNEVVNFYFEVTRPSHKCEVCDGSSLHPDAHAYIAQAFYEHSSPFVGGVSGYWPKHVLVNQGFRLPPEVLTRYGEEFHDYCREMYVHGYWKDRITEDEADMLVAGHSVPDMLWGTAADPHKNPEAARITAKQFNDDNSRFTSPRDRRGLGHDGLNRYLLIKQRCKRLGVPYKCPNPECRYGDIYVEESQVGVVFWILHPRKSASVGARIRRIEQAQVPAVLAFLGQAATRAAERFHKVAAAVSPL